MKFAIGVVGLAVTACDPISGVQTNVELAKPLDSVCVDRTLRSFASAGPVTHTTRRDEGYQILPYRGKVITVLEQWQYGIDQKSSVQISDDGQKRNYFNGMLKMGPPMPAAEVDAFVPLMRRVNAAMETNCGLPLRTSGKVSRN